MTGAGAGLKISKAISYRRYAIAVLGVAVLLGVIALFSISSWVTADNRLRAAQDDYRATWCATFGAESLDQTAFDQWFRFAERNRDFLESKQDLATVDWESGDERTVFEWYLERALEAWNANEPQAPGFARTDWDLQREEAVLKFKLDRHNTVGVESALEESAVLASLEGVLATRTDDFGNPINPVCD